MLANLYQKNIIEKPKLIFTILIICLIGFGYYLNNFRLDASSETLLLEGDPDLKYLNEIKKKVWRKRIFSAYIHSRGKYDFLKFNKKFK